VRHIKSQLLKLLGIAFFAIAIFLAVPKDSALAAADAPSQVTATPGPGKGQVTLSWIQTGTVQRYALVYGLSSNSYTMGLLWFPTDMRSITINDMTTGKQYFIRLWSYDNPDGPATASTEVSAVAK